MIALGHNHPDAVAAARRDPTVRLALDAFDAKIERAIPAASMSPLRRLLATSRPEAAVVGPRAACAPEGAADAIALRPYQREAVAAVHQAARRGVHLPLVALPTGTGKTVVFAHVVRERGGRALVLAHRDELIEQAVEKLGLVMPGVPIGVVKAERDEHAMPITVASIQTLSRANRLERLADDYTTVVVDEAHHAMSDSYLAVLDRLGAFALGGPLTLGVTATPERSDGVGLGHVFEEIVYRKDILEMIEAGYLADLRAIQVRLAVDMGGLHVRAGDFVEREVADLLSAAGAPDRVAEAYMVHARDRRGLVFAPTVALAHAMAEALRMWGIEAEALDGETPTEERRAMLARFRAGTTQVLANCGVLTEGFDMAEIDCVVIARPTRSSLLYQQMIGRGTRLYPGKRDCLILDLVGVATRVDPMTAASLFGVAAAGLERTTLTEAKDAERQARDAAAPEALPGGHLVAVPVDIFRGKRLHWLPDEHGGYVLVAGDLRFRIQQRDGDWTATRYQNGYRDVVHRSPDLGYAQGVAEDLVRQAGFARLADPDAPWRRQPASEKQVALLAARGVAVPLGLTKGQASDLIVAPRAYSPTRGGGPNRGLA